MPERRPAARHNDSRSARRVICIIGYRISTQLGNFRRFRGSHRPPRRRPRSLRTSRADWTSLAVLFGSSYGYPSAHWKRSATRLLGDDSHPRGCRPFVPKSPAPVTRRNRLQFFGDTLLRETRSAAPRPGDKVLYRFVPAFTQPRKDQRLIPSPIPVPHAARERVPRSAESRLAFSTKLSINSRRCRCRLFAGSSLSNKPFVRCRV